VNVSIRGGIGRTVFFLVIAAIICIVIVPILYFITISFASNYEAYRFPARLLPSLSYEARLQFNREEESYSLLIREGEEFVSLKTDTDATRFSEYLLNQLNVRLSPEEVEALFSRARSARVPIELKLRKDFFRNYVTFFLLADGSMEALANSIRAAAWTILISVVLGGVTGYTLARFKFRGIDAFSTGLLAVRMFPAVAISLPMVIYIIRMNLYDTPLSLALVYSVPNIALTAWIMSSIFKGISVELEEAAMVFGASRLKAVLTITIPLAFPAVVASSLYAFLAAWNDSITALIMTNENPTLALLIYRTVGSSTIPNLPAAGAVVLLIPSVVFTFIIKNYINQLWGKATI